MKSIILSNLTLEVPLTLASSIEEHADWLCQHVLKAKYPDGSERVYHGAPHAARVAIYAKAFARLRLLLGAEGADKFSEENIKLVMIASILHDSGREGDDADKPQWEADSAENCLLYLRKIGVDEVRAQAVANLIINKDGKSSDPLVSLLHDGDVFDIIRARNQFVASFLTFFKEFEAHPQVKMIVRVMKHEIEKLIAQQGDGRGILDPTTKAIYSTNEKPFSRVLEDVNAEQYPLLHSLYHSTSDKLLIPAAYTMQVPVPDVLDGRALQTFMVQGKAFLRGINPKESATRGVSLLLMLNEKNENTIQCEIRKDLRSASARRPEGNPHRSTSICYPGTIPFTCLGLVVIPDTKEIISMNNQDSHTGYGKKDNETLAHNPHAKNLALAEILDAHDFGLDVGHAAKQTAHMEAEVHLHKRNIKGIYVSGADSSVLKLMAYYTQLEYKKQSGVELPIFYFNAKLNSVKEFSCNEADALIYWEQLLDATLAPMRMDIFKLETPEQVRKYCISLFHHSKPETDIICHYSKQAQEQVNQLTIKKLNYYKGIIENTIVKANNQAAEAWFQQRDGNGPLLPNEAGLLSNCHALSAEVTVKVAKASAQWFESADYDDYWFEELKERLEFCKRFGFEEDVRPSVESCIKRNLGIILGRTSAWLVSEMYDIFFKSNYNEYFRLEFSDQFNSFLLGQQENELYLYLDDFLLKIIQENLLTSEVMARIEKKLLSTTNLLHLDAFLKLAGRFPSITPEQVFRVLESQTYVGASAYLVNKLLLDYKEYPQLRQHLLEHELGKIKFQNKSTIFEDTLKWVSKILPLGEASATVVSHVQRLLENATKDSSQITLANAVSFLKWYEGHPELGRPTAVVIDPMRLLIEKSQSLSKERQARFLQVIDGLCARKLVFQEAVAVGGVQGTLFGGHGSGVENQPKTRVGNSNKM